MLGKVLILIIENDFPFPWMLNDTSAKIVTDNPGCYSTEVIGHIDVARHPVLLIQRQAWLYI